MKKEKEGKLKKEYLLNNLELGDYFTIWKFPEIYRKDSYDREGNLDFCYVNCMNRTREDFHPTIDRLFFKTNMKVNPYHYDR